MALVEYQNISYEDETTRTQIVPSQAWVKEGDASSIIFVMIQS